MVQMNVSYEVQPCPEALHGGLTPHVNVRNMSPQIAETKLLTN